MILLFLSFALLVTFLVNIRVFIYSLMVYFVLFDMLDGFYEDTKVLAAVRYLLPAVLVVFYLVKELAFNRRDTIFFLLVIYLLILLVYSSTDIVVSGKNLFAVVITLLMIPLGRNLAQTPGFFNGFQPYNRFLLVVIPLYIGVANILGFGESYSEAFTTGFLITSRMYVIPIVVFLAIHFTVTSRDTSFVIRVVDLIFVLVNISILIINTRRTTLGMLGGALLIYPFLNRRVALRMTIIAFVGVFVLVASYPLYEDVLTAQLEQRSRIQDLDTYEEEGRYLETLYIIDHHSRAQSVSQIFFGIKLFDTYDFGTRYFGRDRPIHSDLNMIFFSTGIVGLLLFASCFAQYFLTDLRRIPHECRMVYYPLLMMFIMVLIPGRFIGTMTYAPLLMLLISSARYPFTPGYALSAEYPVMPESIEEKSVSPI